MVVGRLPHVLLVALCVLPVAFSQNCVIPATINGCIKANSSGATISTSCVLTFQGYVPKPREYATQSFTTSGLEPFFKLSRSVISLVAKTPPWGAIQQFLGGNSTEGINELVQWNKTRFFIAAGVGILWCLVAMIGGFVFCCCRCKGRCGARNTFSPKQSDAQTRFFLTLGIGLASCFLLGSSTLMYLTNIRIGEAFGVLTSVTNSSLDRLEAFAHDTTAELKFVTTDQITFLVDQMLLQVTQLGNEAASVGLAAFQQPVNKTATDVLKLHSGAVMALAALQSIKTQTDLLGQLQVNITTSLNSAQISPCTPNDPCDSLNTHLTDAANSIPQNSFPDLTSYITNVQAVINRDLPGQVTSGLRKFNQIPCDIINRTASVRESVASEVSKAKATIDDNVSPILDSLNLTKIFDKSDVTKRTEQSAEYVKKYDLYREISGYVLGSFSLIVVLCIVGGMTCGCCGYQETTKATHRSGASNFGSMMIMVGVYSALLFTFLLMLLSTVVFLVGGHMQVMCPSLRTMEFFDRTLDDVPHTKSFYLIGNAVLKNGSYNITIRSVLEQCEKNASSFQALQLGKKYNLPSMLNSSKITAQIDSQLSSLTQNFNLDTNSFLTADARSSLTSFNSSGIQDINTTAILSQASRTQISQTTIDDAYAQYTAAINAANTANQAAVVTSLMASQGEFNASVDASMKIPAILVSLTADITVLQNITSDLEETIGRVLKSADNLTAHINSFTLEFGNKTAKKYGDRLKGWINSFFTYAERYITTRAANCAPVKTIYDNILGFVCDFTVDTLNGFWLSCGWASFFFIPSIVMGTCLARFYKRMKYEDGFEDDSQQMQLTDLGGKY